jgi:CheY-like chemotaxis protein
MVPSRPSTKPSARILVIDDDEDVRAVIQEALQEAGYDVVLAKDGARGLEAQRRCPADLVVTDVFMPERDGIETIRDLKQEFPDLKIIAMSGGGRLVKNDNYLSTASSLGAESVLHKPFEARVLLESVQKALEPPAG